MIITRVTANGRQEEIEQASQPGKWGDMDGLSGTNCRMEH